MGAEVKGKNAGREGLKSGKNCKSFLKKNCGSALKVIEGAARPVIVAGGGVRASGAQAELVALAEALQIPIATSLNGKDSIPANHPLSVGVAGTY